MTLMVKWEKKEYPQAPEGLQQAVCVDCVDMPNQQGKNGTYDAVGIWFEVETLDPQTGKRYTVFTKMGKSLGQKARLRGFLESWRGRKFTEKELAGFDLETLVGVNCQLQIIHEIHGDTEYANIQAIIASPKTAPKLAPSPDFVRKKDRPAQGSNTEAEDDVPF